MPVDFKDTFAFLIGVQKYRDKKLPALPQAMKNVNEFHEVLTSNKIGLPIENVTVSIDPDNKTELAEDLASVLAGDNVKTLIIYYAGHGIVDENGDHYLTITTSTIDNIAVNGLYIEDISRVLRSARNQKIIFIIDSCFSESAFENFVSRNYLLIASSRMNEPSHYPLGAKCSAFTGELINVFNDGIPNNSPYLTWGEVYQQLVENLRKAGFPLPRISSQNEVDETVAGKNCYKIPEDTSDPVSDKKWHDVIRQISKYDNDFSNEIKMIVDGGGAEMIKQLKGKLLSSLPYLIAYYLEKICRKEVISEDYFNFYDKSVQFLYFVLFLQLEHFKSKEDIHRLTGFNDFKSDFEKPPVQYITFDHLKRLGEEIEKAGMDLFISEINFADTEFVQAAIEIEKLKNENNPDLKKLQDNMMIFIKKAGCLVSYKLLSVKEIRVRFPKYQEKRFSHSVSLLEGIQPTAYEYKDDMIGCLFINQTEPANSPSVILIKKTAEKPCDHINLWPLILDANSVLDAKFPNIYCYVGKEEKSNSLLFKPVRKEVGDDSIPISELDEQADVKPFEELIK